MTRTYITATLPAHLPQDEVQESLDVAIIGIRQFLSDIMEVYGAMTNKNKTMVVSALEETFQREAFCSKLMSLARSCVKPGAA